MSKRLLISADFWDDADYFVSPGRVTAARIRQAEEQLGYRLPAAYLVLRTQNGGTPRCTRFPTATPTSWADVVFDGEFSMGGYAPSFVKDWWDERVQQGHLAAQAEQLRFTPAYEAALQQQLAVYKTD